MEISFEKTSVRKQCENRNAMIRSFGARNAKALRNRLADLSAAEKLGDIAAGHPHPLSGDRLGKFAVSLHKGWRLVFKSANDPLPSTGDGAIDWHKVTKIIIVIIEDYHE